MYCLLNHRRRRIFTHRAFLGVFCHVTSYMPVRWTYRYLDKNVQVCSHEPLDQVFILMPIFFIIGNSIGPAKLAVWYSSAT